VSDAGLFVKEEVAEVPTLGLDLAPGGRRVRCFFKGPDAGINTATGVLITLHGLGGRHNDISYKAMRRAFSSAHNLICVGVNYIGTDAYWRDEAHVLTEAARARMALENDSELATAMLAALESRAAGKVEADPERLFVTMNPHSALECAKPLADDFWDYGCLQAMDVLAALGWLRRRLRESGAAIDWRAVHLVSQSAGAPVALMLMKFAPQTFASWLDVAGYSFDDGDDAATGHLHSVGERGAPSSNQKPLRTVIRSLHGEDDTIMPLDRKESLLRLFVQAGADAALKPVRAADVDGTCFVSAAHEITTNLQAVCARFGPKLWASRLPAGAAHEAATAKPSENRFWSRNGWWVVRHAETPVLRFEVRG
jgi:predicted esterase